MFPKSQLDLYLNCSEISGDAKSDHNCQPMNGKSHQQTPNTTSTVLLELLNCHKEILLYIVELIKSLKRIVIQSAVILCILMYSSLLVFIDRVDVMYYCESYKYSSIGIVLCCEILCMNMLFCVTHQLAIWKVYLCGCGDFNSKYLSLVLGLFESYNSYLWWYSTIHMLLMLVLVVGLQVVVYTSIQYKIKGLIEVVRRNQYTVQNSIQIIKRMQYYCMGKEVFYPNPPSIHSLDSTIRCLIREKCSENVPPELEDMKHMGNCVDKMYFSTRDSIELLASHMSVLAKLLGMAVPPHATHFFQSAKSKSAESVTNIHSVSSLYDTSTVLFQQIRVIVSDAMQQLLLMARKRNICVDDSPVEDGGCELEVGGSEPAEWGEFENSSVMFLSWVTRVATHLNGSDLLKHGTIKVLLCYFAILLGILGLFVSVLWELGCVLWELFRVNWKLLNFLMKIDSAMLIFQESMEIYLEIEPIPPIEGDSLVGPSRGHAGPSVLVPTSPSHKNINSSDSAKLMLASFFATRNQGIRKLRYMLCRYKHRYEAVATLLHVMEKKMSSPSFLCGDLKADALDKDEMHDQMKDLVDGAKNVFSDIVYYARLLTRFLPESESSVESDILLGMKSVLLSIEEHYQRYSSIRANGASESAAALCEDCRHDAVSETLEDVTSEEGNVVKSVDRYAPLALPDDESSKLHKEFLLETEDTVHNKASTSKCNMNQPHIVDIYTGVVKCYEEDSASNLGSNTVGNNPNPRDESMLLNELKLHLQSKPHGLSIGEQSSDNDVATCDLMRIHELVECETDRKLTQAKQNDINVTDVVGMDKNSSQSISNLEGSRVDGVTVDGRGDGTEKTVKFVVEVKQYDASDVLTLVSDSHRIDGLTSGETATAGVAQDGFYSNRDLGLSGILQANKNNPLSISPGLSSSNCIYFEDSDDDL